MASKRTAMIFAITIGVLMGLISSQAYAGDAIDTLDTNVGAALAKCRLEAMLVNQKEILATMSPGSSARVDKGNLDKCIADGRSSMTLYYKNAQKAVQKNKGALEALKSYLAFAFSSVDNVAMNPTETQMGYFSRQDRVDQKLSELVNRVRIENM